MLWSAISDPHDPSVVAARLRYVSPEDALKIYPECRAVRIGAVNDPALAVSSNRLFFCNIFQALSDRRKIVYDHKARSIFVGAR